MHDYKKIFEKVIKKERITKEEGLCLFNKAELGELGFFAHKLRLELHPAEVTYIRDRNINYTNICISACRFCAFYRKKDHPSAYVISDSELFKKIEESFLLGGKQVLLQGGMNPELGLAWHEDMLKKLKINFPDLHIHAYSPPEIAFFADREEISDKECIKRLISAGLDSIPGGGAEILVDSVRSRIAPGKCLSERWLSVMEKAHELGLKSSATMMFGHIESPEDILTHLDRLRSLQDKTKGFTAFIPWSFQPGNSELGMASASAVEYLRILALSRLYLDNFNNIQASWVTQGAKIAELALFFGANDMGSTMIEENVIAAAGLSYSLSPETLRRLISKAGFIPVERNFFYEKVKVGEIQNS